MDTSLQLVSENGQLRRGPSKPAALWKLEGQQYVQRGAFLGWRSFMADTSFGYVQKAVFSSYQQHAKLEKKSHYEFHASIFTTSYYS